jgi:metallophosphoesterase (TIGR00282 family)
MKVLFLGDIVGSPARQFLLERLSKVKQQMGYDFVVANGENSAAGSSFTLESAREIFNSGVDVVTSGDHVFKKKEAKDVLAAMDVLRPLNWSEFAPGRGYLIKEKNGLKIGVINLVGRVFMQPVDCPFNAVRKIIDDVKRQARIVIVDMHAEATSEKLAMGHYLSGKVSAVLGTHTHIPTADERIIDNYTAYITDVGMTGSCDSILGREKQNIIDKFVTNIPIKFELATGDVRMQGVSMEFDPVSGKALSIQRVEWKRNG